MTARDGGDEDFLAIDNVLEVKNVPLAVERGDGWISIGAPGATEKAEVMKGANGKPIRVRQPA